MTLKEFIDHQSIEIGIQGWGVIVLAVVVFAVLAWRLWRLYG